MISEGPSPGHHVITDRFTAKVLGATVLVIGLLIDVSFLIFLRKDLGQKPGLIGIVLVPSLPIFLFSVWLFRRAAQLKDEGGD